MTDAEYQQLLNESEAFSRLSEDLQQTIVGADGEEREQYMHIFLTERRGILAAQQELARSNEKTLNDFETKIDEHKRDLLKNSEEVDRAGEAEKAENLLHNLDS